MVTGSAIARLSCRKKYLADYLPELAIPKVKSLLSLPNLDQTAKAELLTLLGEAQIRTALDSSEPVRSKTSRRSTQNA